MWNLFASRGTLALAAAFVSPRHLTSQSSARSFSVAAKASTQYILTYDYVADVLEKRGPHREKHLELAKELCISGGPTTPLDAEVPTGALFIFADTEKANSFVKQDPYVTEGIVTGWNIQEWTVAIQN